MEKIIKVEKRATVVRNSIKKGATVAVGKGSKAWGTSFNMSSLYRMSFLKNGSFYDVDRGVDPDYSIIDPNNIYNREKFVSFINNLM